MCVSHTSFSWQQIEYQSIYIYDYMWHIYIYIIYILNVCIYLYNYVCDLIAQWISKPFQTILFAFKQLIGFNLLTHHDPKQFQRFFPLVALLACADCLGIFFRSTRALSGVGACLDDLIPNSDVTIMHHHIHHIWFFYFISYAPSSQSWTLNMFEHLWTPKPFDETTVTSAPWNSIAQPPPRGCTVGDRVALKRQLTGRVQEEQRTLPLTASRQIMAAEVLQKMAIPSGNLTMSYWTWPFIVDFPMKNCHFQ